MIYNNYIQVNFTLIDNFSYMLTITHLIYSLISDFSI